MKAFRRAGFLRYVSERVLRTGLINLAIGRSDMLSASGHAPLLGSSRVDLGDVSARKLYHGRDPSVRLVWFDEQDATGGLCLGQGRRQVLDLVSGQLAAVR